jgi:hypothetical protein
MPDSGHCSSAATSASCARSSASPTSRTMRARLSDDLRRLDAPDRVDRPMGVGSRHGYRITSSFCQRCPECRAQLTISASPENAPTSLWCSIAGPGAKSSSSKNGRSSTSRPQTARVSPTRQLLLSIWLDDPESGNRFLRLGERTIDDRARAARILDARTLGRSV